jgi:hypothetical protein
VSITHGAYDKPQMANLTLTEQDLVRDLFTVVVKAVSPDDPTGHIPNCGYTDEHQVCDCAAFGGRLHDALVKVVYSAGLKFS